MDEIQKLYHALAQHISPRTKARVRAWLDSFDIGKNGYFSQFGEDAFLQSYFTRKAWQRAPHEFLRFFRGYHVERGFYIDVGAYAPKQFSNTYRFYKQGWRGINIDATPGSMYAFKLARRRDINLQVAISSQETELLFYCWGIPTVVNTLSADKVPELSALLGHEPIEMRVQAVRLELILDEYCITQGSSDRFSFS